MECAMCAYCYHAKVEESLEEDAMGFEYVEKQLICELDECDFNGICEE